MLFDVAAIEARFRSVESTVEGDLHSKVGQAIVAAAKDLLGLLPDGAEIESILAELDRVAVVAHQVVTATAPPEAPPAAPEPPAAPVEGPAPETVAEASAATEATASGDVTPPPEATAGQARPQ